ncbi:hypothetical protein P0Y43_09360 [Pseudomonas entomophila]|uniref:DUF6124 family protein n=1 Tax=Pseudomonas entomophila TaxID=312306 RepID=UPI0023D840A1|nr:hypothetical protein [Pseudomonas entomophila]MDF0730931.1 hypothetical protein [Pseudomonas entomophila]
MKSKDTELDSEAARRALDYYLNPSPPHTSIDTVPWTLREDVSTEQANAHALALLRCAAATAHETGHSQQGTTREVLFALMHMVNMARSMLEQRQVPQRV